MASMMTIESSTRMPIVSERPISERTSIVKPAIHIAANAAQSEAGIDIAAISAFRQACKKEEHHQDGQHDALGERLQDATDCGLGVGCVAAQRRQSASADTARRAA